MNIGSALKTKTSKAIVAGTVLAAAMSFGVSGTASANQYNGGDWRGNDNHNKRHDNNNCENSFWAYNRNGDRWFRVGYNEHTDRWEVCRHNDHDDYNRYNNDNKYDDNNWSRDNDYWDKQGRHENENSRYSVHGRRDY